jgi:hypothetical protein
MVFFVGESASVKEVMAFTCLHNSLDLGDSDSKCASVSTVIALMHRFFDGLGSVLSSEKSAIFSRNLSRKCSMVEMWKESRVRWMLKRLDHRQFGARNDDRNPSANLQTRMGNLNV